MTIRPAVAPKVPGLPLLGNAIGLSGDVRSYLTTQYLAHGPVFRLNALGREIYVLAGQEANRFVTQQGADLFRSDIFWGPQDRIFGVRSLVSMDGPEHAQMRKLQKPGYSRARMLSRVSEAVDLVRDQLREWPENRPLTATHTFQKLAAGFLGPMLADVAPGETFDDIAHVVRVALLIVTGRRPGLLQYTPRFATALRRFEEFGRRVVDLNRARENTTTPNLVRDLLALKREHPDLVSDDELAFYAMGPFIAGLDTVASTCSFMLYALLSNPELAARVRAEADTVFSDGNWDGSTVKGLDVLHRVALETHRVYPTSPAIYRHTAKEFTFAGFTIPADRPILLATTVTHYLPDLFPDPERFDIDRYGPERNEHRQSGAFVPYGIGPHTCLGAGAADVQILVTMAVLFHELDVEMVPADYRLRIVPDPGPRPDRRFRFSVRRRTSH